MDTGNNWNQNTNEQNNNNWNQNSNGQNNGWNQNTNGQNNGWNQNSNGQNNGWNQNSNGQFGGYNSYPMPGAGFINASYICGTLSIATTILCTVYLPYIFGALSIVFAILSRGNAAKMARKAASAIRLAVIGLIMNTALIVTCFTIVFTNPQVHDELNRISEQVYGQSFDELMEGIESGKTPTTDGTNE